MTNVIRAVTLLFCCLISTVILLTTTACSNQEPSQDGLEVGFENNEEIKSDDQSNEEALKEFEDKYNNNESSDEKREFDYLGTWSILEIVDENGESVYDKLDKDIIYIYPNGNVKNELADQDIKGYWENNETVEGVQLEDGEDISSILKELTIYFNYNDNIIPLRYEYDIEADQLMMFGGSEVAYYERIN